MDPGGGRSLDEAEEERGRRCGGTVRFRPREAVPGRNRAERGGRARREVTCVFSRLPSFDVTEEKDMSTDAQEMAALRPRRGRTVVWIAVAAVVIAVVVVAAGGLMGWFGSPPSTIVGAGAS